MQGSATNTESQQALVIHYEALRVLAAELKVSETWMQTACETTSEIVELLSSERNEKDSPALELFAKLVSKCPEQPVLFQKFAHVLLLHFYHPQLFSKLWDILASRPPTPTGEPAFQVPEWWPACGENQNLDVFASPFEFGSNLEEFVKAHAHDVHLILHTAAMVLPQLQMLTKEPTPSWSCFASLISVMLKSVAHRDLTCIIICHDENAIAMLHRLSLLSALTSGQRYAKFILELLMIRPPVLNLLSMICKLPGARRLLQIYPQSQLGAFEVAAKTPFRFIVDLLNHTSGSSWFSNGTVINCISISSQTLEWLGDNADLTSIYEEFNKVSEINSLLSVCTQFGCVTAQCLLGFYGDNICTSKQFRALNGFLRSALPPLAKPNYFFAEQKPAPSNETLVMFSKLDEYDELHRTLLRILKFLSVIFAPELTETATLAPGEGLSEKIYMRTIQPIYSFMLLALKCNEKLDLSNLTSQFTNTLIFKIMEQLLRNAESSLAWTTLFNHATETSYSEISTLRIWFKFLQTLCTDYKNDRHKELVRDGFDKFSATFFPDTKPSNIYSSPYMSLSQATFGVITKNEYMFLYDNLSRRKGEHDDTTQSKMTSHYNMGGRQQSVHVDKFGKDRS
ncbi:hypothetical protein METBIDRAFT_195810 [Metschnikowia bicuspidata var. bicuspidata NRRL YB-4993]|uniref:Uncharacterized protein n=1 Tax=Metschnikowia bicuspidata var. bicuspidata NRRL YB-4993 TaxID=869754 RepID=A0A1A0H8H4_9ASCO|nr:hypothetical protein METBIDRAFT_195810 [Metschnikowia bicuspidata var. bicuspidata NRRL YB-4993]OBA20290.1 hypothetical protein METBIDRAFT_195810 [Metschnikowia bicuspidata var. bicuspidata NRRL YB-4993]